MSLSDVTVIPDKYYSIAHKGPIQPVQRILTGADQQQLRVQRQFVGLLQYNNLQTEQNIFVIKGLSKPLLSHDSSLLTTFLIPFSRFCFKRSPFEITLAPEYFQRRISKILSGLKGVVCFTDNVLLHGATQEDHDKNLLAVLS